ncbi:hypothetical protein RI570_21470 [Brucella pseudogrignonensis]|uniref:hypothetical protein n=1 Tax=Brucella pseudogrignonensis TaxID=419475 RepID=UPI0028B731FD|nr:hypothetical protein [Brucella pseudogrignonensis]MDT6941952.1 hypothetical protein [Brucella pseudogrignonensis]MDT6942581.1 hypothetical protein [Brucella pseudogrignonensis]MDT6942623.1 hypothetical protein [Brucella pseudogrignonensis]
MGNIKELGDKAFRDYVNDGVPSSGANNPKKAEIRQFISEIDRQVDELSVSGDTVTKATWAQLSAVAGTRNGQRGYVEADSGTHTDPVVGGTVQNNGIYTWSTSPAGWRWLRFDDYNALRIDAKRKGIVQAQANISQVSFDGTQIVVTIGDGRAWEGSDGVAATAFSGGTFSLTTNIGLVLDLDAPLVNGKIPVSVRSYVSTIVNGPNGFVDDNKVLLLGLANSSSSPVFIGLLAEQAAVLYWRQVPKYPQDQILVRRLSSGGQGDLLYVSMKSSNSNSDQYINYRMQRLLSVSKQSDVWRLSGVYIAPRVSPLSIPIGAALQVLEAQSEVEFAVKQAGKPDFMGGLAHGYEKQFSTFMLVDGKMANMTPGGDTTIAAKQVEVVSKSTIYEYGSDPLKPVGIVSKRWKFEYPWVEISTHVTWSADLDVDACYLAMLPVKRLANDGVTQVTDTAIRSPEWVLEDVSTAGFEQVITQADRYRIWGGTGYSAEVEMLEGWDQLNRKSYISNSPGYNKIYFDRYGNVGAGTVTPVQSGDTMTCRWRFRLDFDG